MRQRRRRKHTMAHTRTWLKLARATTAQLCTTLAHQSLAQRQTAGQQRFHARLTLANTLFTTTLRQTTTTSTPTFIVLKIMQSSIRWTLLLHLSLKTKTTTLLMLQKLKLPTLRVQTLKSSCSLEQRQRLRAQMQQTTFLLRSILQS